MGNEQVIEKIKKVLNLAQNNPSKEEAEAAMMKVQELLLKYDLTMECLNSPENKVKRFEVDKIGFEELIIACAIAPFFRVDVFFYTIDRRRGFCIGTENDVTIFLNLLKYCMKYFKRQRMDFFKNRKLEILKMKSTGDHLHWNGAYWEDKPIISMSRYELNKSFRIGFIVGLKKKFSENANKFALVLTKSKEHTDMVKEQNAKEKKMGGGRSLDNKAYMSGLKAGSEFKKQNNELHV